MADFPTSVKNFLVLQDGVDTVLAQHPNDRADEITAIQTMLGAMGIGQSNTESYRNFFKNYLKGCKVTKNSVSQITVKAGELSISNAAGSIVKFRRNTSDTTVTWANIDTGGEASATRYYVYAVADATSTTFTVTISTSASAPSGKTYYRKIGSFYNNASSDIEDVIDDFVHSLVETASMKPWPVAALPGGWWYCDGSAHNASTDPTWQALYDVIGNDYGGNDNTDFVLPDLRGRVPIGLDNMGGSSANRVVASWADTIGGTGGSELYTLSTSEIPAHHHTYNTRNENGWGSGQFMQGSNDGVTSRPYDSLDSSNTGGGTAFSVMQPSIAMLWIIKK